MMRPTARAWHHIGHMNHGAARPVRRLGPGFAVFKNQTARGIDAQCARGQQVRLGVGLGPHHIIDRDNHRKAVAQPDHRQFLQGICAGRRCHNSAGQMGGQPQHIQNKGFQRDALVRLGLEIRAPQGVQVVNVDGGMTGTDQGCGAGLIDTDQPKQKAGFHRKPGLGKGGKAGPCGNAFRVNQGSVKVEQQGLIHRGLRYRPPPISHHRCRRKRRNPVGSNPSGSI